MKIYLDDERETPKGWRRVYTAEECISAIEEVLSSGLDIDILSLDHDLGQHMDGTLRSNGETVIKWMEQTFRFHDKIPPFETRIHSANPVARERMQAALNRLYKRT